MYKKTQHCWLMPKVELNNASKCRYFICASPKPLAHSLVPALTQLPHQTFLHLAVRTALSNSLDAVTSLGKSLHWFPITHECQSLTALHTLSLAGLAIAQHLTVLASLVLLPRLLSVLGLHIGSSHDLRQDSLFSFYGSLLSLQVSHFTFSENLSQNMPSTVHSQTRYGDPSL